MYSVCYVVTDNEKLTYYNELVISLASLRKHGNDCPVVILTDKSTAAEIRKQKYDDLGELKAELRVIDAPASYSQKENSRFIKTSMREYVSGDFLFIDTDTVIAEPLNLCYNGELALALDYNTDLKGRQEIDDLHNLIQKNKLSGYTLDVAWPYYNSGCIWAEDTAKVHAFFHQWHEEWKRCRDLGVVVDQPALNYVNRVMEGLIQELDGVYNVQISSRVTPINLLHKAKIIHYYNGNFYRIYLLQNPEIRSLGYKIEDIQRIISCPKEAFHPSILLTPTKQTSVGPVKDTAIYSAMMRLYEKHLLLFRIMDYPFSLLRKIRKRIM